MIPENEVLWLFFEQEFIVKKRSEIATLGRFWPFLAHLSWSLPILAHLGRQILASRCWFLASISLSIPIWPLLSNYCQLVSVLAALSHFFPAPVGFWPVLSSWPELT